jgi:hypothetical protein
MKQFIQTEFFRLLRNNSQEENLTKKLDKVYEKFASLLFAESNKSSLFDYRNALCYARVEFACLQQRDEMKKKQCRISIY